MAAEGTPKKPVKKITADKQDEIKDNVDSNQASTDNVVEIGVGFVHAKENNQQQTAEQDQSSDNIAGLGENVVAINAVDGDTDQTADQDNDSDDDEKKKKLLDTEADISQKIEGEATQDIDAGTVDSTPDATAAQQQDQGAIQQDSGTGTTTDQQFEVSTQDSIIDATSLQDGITTFTKVNIDNTQVDIINAAVDPYDNTAVTNRYGEYIPEKLEVDRVEPVDENIAPTANIVSTLELINTGSTITFNAANNNSITVNDQDIEGNDAQVTVSVGSGVLNLPALDFNALGLEVSGNGSNNITLKGTIAALNQALDGLEFDPSTSFSGFEQLTVSINDLGSTGEGGPLTASDSVALAQNGIELSLVGAQVNIGLQAPFYFIGDGLITVNDTNADSDIFIQLTSSEGTFEYTGSTAAGQVATGNNTNTIELQSTTANINTDLQNIRFIPDAGTTNAASITITGTDLPNGVTGTYSSLNVSTTLDIVSNTLFIDMSTPNQTFNMTAKELDNSNNIVANVQNLDGGNLIQINDLDANPGDIINIQLTAVGGRVDFSSTVAGATVGAGDSNTITMSDNLANVNNALQLLTFSSNDGFSGDATIEVRANDLPGTPLTDPSTEVKTLTIKVSDAINNLDGTNSDINIAGRVEGTPEDTDSLVSYQLVDDSSNNLITVSDVGGNDSSTITMQLVATNGTMTTGSFTNETEITITDTVGNLNTALNALEFTPTDGFSGGATIEVYTNNLTGILTDSDNTDPSNYKQTFNININDAVSRLVEVNDTDSINIVARDDAASDDLDALIASHLVNQTNDNLITVADVGGTDSSEITIQLLAENGTMSFTGFDFSGYAEATIEAGKVTITDTVLKINNALNALEFTPTDGFSGAAKIDVYTNNIDGVLTHADNTDKSNYHQTLTINVNDAVSRVMAVGDNDSINIRGRAEVSDDVDTPAAISFTDGGSNLITVEDSGDADSSQITIQLVATNGTMTTVGFTDEAKITITDTVANINTVLNSLEFTPDDINGSAQIEIFTNNIPGVLTDTDNTDPSNYKQTFAININEAVSRLVAVGDTDTINIAAREDSGGNPYSLVTHSLVDGGSNLITVEDVRGDNSSEITIQLVSVNGKMSTVGFTDVNKITVTDTVGDINTLLASLEFTPDDGFSGVATIDVYTNSIANILTDADNTDPSNYQQTLTINVNDAAIVHSEDSVNFNVHNVTGPDLYAVQDFAFTGPNAITLHDNSPQTNPVTVRLVASGGKLTATDSGLTVFDVPNTEDNTVNLVGSSTNVQTVLDSLIFTPTAGTHGIATINMYANNAPGIDILDASSYTDTLEIKVNDATVAIAAGSTNTFNARTYNPLTNDSHELAEHALGAGMIVVADTGGDNSSTITLELTATDGTMAFATDSNSVLANNSITIDNYQNTFTLTGPVGDLNTVLEQLAFKGDTDFSGTATIVVKANNATGVAVSDASSFEQTLNINVSNATVSLGDNFNLKANTELTSNTYDNYVHNFTGGDLIELGNHLSDSSTIHLKLVATGGLLNLTDNGMLANLNISAADGSGNNYIEISGEVQHVEAVLATLTFDAATGFNGAGSVAMYSNTLDVTGLGIDIETDPSTYTWTVNININDAAIKMGADSTNFNVHNVTGPDLYATQDLAFTGTERIVLEDLPNQNHDVTVRLIATEGKLSVTNASLLDNLSSHTVPDAEDNTVDLVGSASDVQAVLDAMIFTPTTGEHGAATVTIYANNAPGVDILDASSYTRTFTINVNDATVAIAAGSTNTINLNAHVESGDDNYVIAEHALGAGMIAVTDTGGDDNSVITIELAVTGGTIAFGADSNDLLVVDNSISLNDYQTSFTITGARGDINTVLDSLLFKADAGATLGTIGVKANNATGVAVTDTSSFEQTLTINLTDATIAITDVDGVDTVLINQQPGVASAVAMLDGGSQLITISNPTGSDANITVKLAATDGTIAFSENITSFGAGNGDINADSPVASHTMTGNLADINTALSKLQFTPTTSITGSEAIVVKVNDNPLITDIDDASSLTQTLNITVNLAPVNAYPAAETAVPGPIADNVITNIVNDGKISIPISEVLANDTDAATANASITSISVTTGSGAVAINDGYIEYFPVSSESSGLGAGASANIVIDYETSNILGDSAAPGQINLEIKNVADLSNTDTAGKDIIIGSGTGTGANETITATTGSDYIDTGGAASGFTDIVTSDTGADMFLFKTGYNALQINDFDITLSTGDKIDISDFNLANFAALQALMTQNGPNTEIAFNANDIITLNNITLGDLVADHFILETPLAAGRLSVIGGETLVFNEANDNLISVSDVDDTNLTVTLTATEGTLTLSGNAGLTFDPPTDDGINAATMKFSGTQTDINAALDGMSFTAVDTPTGNGSIEIVTDDGKTTDTDTINIKTNTLANNAVVILGGGSFDTIDIAGMQEQSGQDNVFEFKSTDIDSNKIQVDDLVADDSAVMTVQLATSDGTMNLTTTTGLSFSEGDGANDAAMTFSGTVANINTALNTLDFTPSSNTIATAAITIRANSIITRPISDPSSYEDIFYLNVNDATVSLGGGLTDTIALPAYGDVVNESPDDTFNLDGAALGAGTIQVNDPGGDGTSVITIELTAAKGLIKFAPTSDILTNPNITTTDYVDGNYATTINITGQRDALNSVLDDLMFKANSTGFDGTATISAKVNNISGAAGSDTASFEQVLNINLSDATITITDGTATDTALISQEAGVASAVAMLDGGSSQLITIADPNTLGNDITVKLAATDGTLSFSTTINGISGMTTTNETPTIVTMTGSLTAVNTALAALEFTPTVDFTDVAEIAVTVNNNPAITNIDDPANLTQTLYLDVNTGPVNTIPTVNEAAVPVTANDQVITNLADGSKISIPISEILANDPGAAAANATITAVSVTTGAGNAVINGPYIEYTPTAAESSGLGAEASFNAQLEYTTTNAAGDSVSPGVINLEIKNTNTLVAGSNQNMIISRASADGVLNPIIHDFAEGTTPYAFDVDGDNKVDIVTGDSSTLNLLWYKNLGEGNFSAPQQIGSGFSNYNAIGNLLRVVDYDGDGDLDLISSDVGNFLYFENNGSGFDAGVPLLNNGWNYRAFEAGDLDKDGDVDLIGIRNYVDLHWHESNDGVFDIPVEVIKQSGAMFSSYNYLLGDFVGDDKLDVVVDITPGNDTSIYIYESQASGQDIIFVEHQIQSSGVYTWSGYTANVTGDFDGDGDLDIAYTLNSSGNTAASIVIYENEDADDTFTAHEIVSKAGVNSIGSLAAFDYNGDGKLDIIAQSNDTNYVYENQNATTSDITSWNETVINGLTGANSFYRFEQADFNGDGNQDILYHRSSTGKLAWFDANNIDYTVDQITGTAGSDYIDGRGAPSGSSDTVTGDPLSTDTGTDIFIFKPGYNALTITDFDLSDGDKIDLSSFGTNFTALDAMMTEEAGPNTVIDLGNGDIITLNGISKASLTADRFIFDAPLSGGKLTVTEGETLVLSASNDNVISVADVDTANLTVTLTATNGTITLSSGTDLTNITGNGTAVVTITSRTIADINAALDGMSFAAGANAGGSGSIQIATSDGHEVDTDIINLTINPPDNNVIVILGEGAFDTINIKAMQESSDNVFAVQATAIDSNKIQVDDLANDDSVVIKARLTSSNGDMFFSSNVAFTDGAGGAGVGDTNANIDFTSLDIQGTVAEINAALNLLNFEPTNNTVNSGGITVRVNGDINKDITDSSSYESTLIIKINDATVSLAGGASDTISVPAYGDVVNESPDDTFNFGGASLGAGTIQVDDPGGSDTSVISIELTAANGQLKFADGSTILTDPNITSTDYVDGNYATTINITGQKLALNTVLNDLLFKAADPFNGSATIDVKVNNVPGVAASDASSFEQTLTINMSDATIAITDVDGVDTVLINQQPGVASAVAMLDGGSQLITISNPTGSDANITVKLAATDGTIAFSENITSFGAGNGDINTGVDVASHTMTGTLTDINAALSKLQFTPTTSITGSEAIVVKVNDNPLIADIDDSSSLTQTLNINVNIAPVNAYPAAEAAVPAPITDNVITNIVNGNKISIPISEVLANDTDAATANASITSISVTTGSGAVVVNGNYIEYFPVAGESTGLGAGLSANIVIDYETTNIIGDSAAPGQINLEIKNVADLSNTDTAGKDIIIGSGTGTGANETITATTGGDYIDTGGAASGFTDIVTSDTGADTFLFKTGYNALQINDFDITLSTGDKIDVSDFNLANFAALQALMTQNGPNTEIAFNANDIITLNNVNIGDLVADHFILETPLAAGKLSVVAGETLVFNDANDNLISVSDADDTNLTVTLTATEGALTLSGTTGLSFTTGDGTDDTTMEFSGSQTDINAALDGISFTAVANPTGNGSIEIVTNDGKTTDTDTINIKTHTLVNNAVVILGGGSFDTINISSMQEQAGQDNVFELKSTDIDSNKIQVDDTVEDDSAVMTVQLATSDGAMNLTTTTGLAFSEGDGANDTAMTFSGTVANINAALNTLDFTPSNNTTATAAITIRANSISTRPISDASSYEDIFYLNINDATVSLGGGLTDTISVPAYGDVVDESPDDTFNLAGASLGAGTIQVDDPGGSDSSVISIELTAANGTIAFSADSNSILTNNTITLNDYQSSFTLTGAKSDLNTVLDSLLFKATADFNGTATIGVKVNNISGVAASDASSFGQTLSINVSDATISVVDGTTDTFAVNQHFDYISPIPVTDGGTRLISVDDPGGDGSTEITIKLTTNAGEGTIEFGAQVTDLIDGVINANTARTSFVIKDTEDNLNTLLDGLIYNRLNNTVTGPATIDIKVNNNPNISDIDDVSSLSQTLTLNITESNVAPVNVIPLATGAPTSVNDTVITNLVDETAIRIPIDQILGNDGDVFAENLSITNVSVTTGDGSAFIVGRNIEYYPTPDESSSLAADASSNIVLEYTVTNNIGSTTADINLEIKNSTNLTGSGEHMIFGNAAINTLTGTAAADYIDAGGTAVSTTDTVDGTDDASADIFVFKQGYNKLTINNFHTNEDKIDISDFGLTGIGDISSIVDDGSGNAKITVTTGQEIILMGVSFAALTATDFIFSSAPIYSGFNVEGTNTLTFNSANGNLISVTDADTDINQANTTVDLEIVDGGGSIVDLGDITLSGNGSNLTITGDGSHDVRVVGKLADVQAALDGMTFVANAAAFNSTVKIRMTTDDSHDTDVDNIDINVIDPNISPVNIQQYTAPTAAPGTPVTDTVITNIVADNAVIRIPIAQILANDGDIAAENLSLSSVALIGGGSGSVIINGNYIEYTNAVGEFSGLATDATAPSPLQFSYTVSNNVGQDTNGQIDVTVKNSVDLTSSGQNIMITKSTAVSTSSIQDYTFSDAISQFRLLDVDGDTDIDVVASSYDGSELFWYQNLGNSNFSTKQLISNQINKSPYDIDSFPLGVLDIADYDGDGDMDIFTYSADQLNIIYFQNINAGTLSQAGTFNINMYGVDFEMVDLNNDNLLDVAIMDNNGNLYWYPNLSGTLGSRENISNNSYSLDKYALVHGNFIGDSNQDLLAIARLPSPGDERIHLYENVNNGSSFTLHKITPEIAPGDNFRTYWGDLTPETLAAGYFNNDSYLDFAYITYTYDSDPNAPTGTLGVALNNGNGTFQQQFIDTLNLSNARDTLSLVYYDDDAWVDLVAGISDADLNVYLNQQDGSFSTVPQSSNISRSHKIRIDSEDLSGDGKKDLAYAEGNNFHWRDINGIDYTNEQLTGTTGADYIDGGGAPSGSSDEVRGDPVGGPTAADTFVFRQGYNSLTIADFDKDGGDKIDISDFGTDFATLDAGLITQDGLDTKITLNGNQIITLSGVTATTLTAAQFIFSSVAYGPYTTDNIVPLVFNTTNSNAVSVLDPDIGANNLTVDLVLTDNADTPTDLGVINLSTTANLTVTGNGTNTVNIVGTQADINAALDGMSYVANQAAYNSVIKIKMTTSDGIESDTDDIEINVINTNAPPVNVFAYTVPTGAPTAVTDANIITNIIEDNQIIRIPITEILANDGNGIVTDNLSISSVATTGQGDVAINGNYIEYTVKNGEFSSLAVDATDTLGLTYTVANNVGEDTGGVITVTVKNTADLTGVGDNIILARPTAVGTPFSNTNTFGTTAVGTFEAADFNNDGDIDVIMADRHGGNGTAYNLFWYENLGSGSFSTVNSIASLSSQVNHLEVGDFNNDNFVDVITSNWSDNKVVFYANTSTQNGPITFAAGVELFTLPHATRDIVVSDIDDDGNLDIVASQGSGDMYWYEGDGATTPSFTPHEIMSNKQLNYGYKVADFTGDGLPDIAAISSADNKYYLYQNSPTQTFTQVDMGGVGAGDTVYAPIGQTATSEDFNQDSHRDYVSVVENGGNYKLQWHANNSSGASFTVVEIATSTSAIYNVYAIDYNNDTWQDLAVLKAGTYDMDVYLNMSASAADPNNIQNNEVFNAPAIVVDSLSFKNSAFDDLVSKADLNKDGTDNLIALTSGNQVAWLEEGINYTDPTITGTASADYIDGGGAPSGSYDTVDGVNDSSADTFVFKQGYNALTINNFDKDDGDRIDISDFGLTAIGDINDITDNGTDTIITVTTGQVITLAGVTGVTLENSHFKFTADPYQGPYTTTEDSALVFNQANSNLISVSDPDIGAGDLTITFTTSGGEITLSETTNLTFTVGDGTSDNQMTFSGALVDINNALDGMSYISEYGTFDNRATIEMSTADEANTTVNTIELVMHNLLDDEGSAIDDIINGTVGDDVIDGLGAATGTSDQLTGGGGSDQFIFKPGYGSATITDFDNANDTINLSAFGLVDETHLDFNMIDDGTDTTITVASDLTILIEDDPNVTSGNIIF